VKQEQKYGCNYACCKHAAELAGWVTTGWDRQLRGTAIIEIRPGEDEDEFDDSADHGVLPQPKAQERQVAGIVR
jgi:hypothetical protein